MTLKVRERIEKAKKEVAENLPKMLGARMIQEIATLAENLISEMYAFAERELIVCQRPQVSVVIEHINSKRVEQESRFSQAIYGKIFSPALNQVKEIALAEIKAAAYIACLDLKSFDQGKFNTLDTICYDGLARDAFRRIWESVAFALRPRPTVSRFLRFRALSLTKFQMEKAPPK